MQKQAAYLTGLFIVVLFGLNPGCAAKFNQLEEPKLNLVGFKLIDAQLLEQRYELTFRLLNPNDVALPITGIYYEVELAGKAFATGVNASPVDVPAYGETRVTVEMSTTLLQSIRQLATLAEAQPQQLDFHLKGHLNVNLPMLGKIPFSEKGQIKLRQ
jgi:LEA14-like dessication related protein